MSLGHPIQPVPGLQAGRAFFPAEGSLSRMLLLRVLALGFVLALGATVLNGWLSFRSESARQQAQLQAVIAAYSPGLGKAVWDLDEEAVRAQLSGLSQFPALLSAEVIGPQMQQRYVKTGGRLAQGSLPSSYPLKSPDGLQVIADWRLRLDDDIVLQQVWQASRSFIWVVAAELLLQALLVYALVLRGVSRPLLALSAHVGRLGVQGLAQPAPAPANGPRHELHALAQGITQLQQELQAQLAHRDATALKLAQQRDELDALYASQRRQLDDVLHRMADGAGVLDAQGGILLANPAWAALMALEAPATLIGQGVSQWLRWPTWPALLARLEAEGALTACTIELKRQDGRDWPVEASLSVIEREPQGPIARAQIVLHDVSARVETERSLIAAREAALAAARAKSEFLANMSHEIRTPMNAVLGFTELTLATALSERQRDYLDKTRSAAQSLLGVLNDILDFSKIEAGKLEVAHLPFELPQVLESVRSIASLQAHAKGLPCRVELASEVPGALVGDALRLRQVLVNLYSNAVKFTQQGQVLLQVSQVAGPPGRTRLRFEVSDTGIGMSAAEVARLFQPFTQADTSMTRRYGGTGLGLAISRQLVQLMGGQIQVRSTAGAGSTFSFELDFEQASPGFRDPLPALPGAHALPGLSGHAGLTGLRVLLVEDNPVNQQLAQELMGSVGVQVSLASHGGEALRCLAQATFDLVLMDVQMPEMDGYEATRRIRSQPAHASLPIIAMTAHAMASERERCLQAGMNDFLSKPFDPQALYGVLARWDRRSAKRPV
jgi:two-component system, sensor histidine kinase and response regulator